MKIPNLRGYHISNNNSNIFHTINSKTKFSISSSRKFRCRTCCLKFLLFFSLAFISFWTVIIFYASKREEPLNIYVSVDYPLPVITANNTRSVASSSSNKQIWPWKQAGNNTSMSTDSVPKILHQLWKSKHIPPRWKEAHHSCLQLNPDYRVIIWTDEMIYNFMSRFYPWFYKFFLAYPYHIQRVDVARYFILYHYGGVYLDIDAMCKTPFEDIIANMTSAQTVLLPNTDIYGVTNSFMISKKSSAFFKFVMYELPFYAKGPYTLIRHTTIIFSTGPTFLSRCVDSYKSPEDIAVMPIREYEEKHFAHAKGGSWHGLDTEIVDIFHFHSLELFTVLGIFVFLVTVLRCKRDFLCCCINWLRLQLQRNAAEWDVGKMKTNRV